MVKDYVVEKALYKLCLHHQLLGCVQFYFKALLIVIQDACSGVHSFCYSGEIGNHLNKLAHTMFKARLIAFCCGGIL